MVVRSINDGKMFKGKSDTVGKFYNGCFTTVEMFLFLNKMNSRKLPNTIIMWARHLSRAAPALSTTNDCATPSHGIHAISTRLFGREEPPPRVVPID
jgi:hypothetical protein